MARQLMAAGAFRSSAGVVKDFIITGILWIYYILGYVVILSPLYLFAWFFPPIVKPLFKD